MLPKTKPFVIGYITQLSNEVSMLKSIMRFARARQADWMIMYLRSGQSATDVTAIVPNLDTLPEMCQSLGGDFASIDCDADVNFLKFPLFEVAVKGYHIISVLVDHTMSKTDFKSGFLQQLQLSLPPALELINIEDKHVFLSKSARSSQSSLQWAKRFFLQSCADIMVGLLFGLFAVVMTYTVHYTLNHHVAHVDDAYTYMVFVLFANLCALQAGIWGGVMCTLVTALSANYFFVEPHYYFKLTNLSDMVNWLMLVITSSVTSIISATMIIQFRKSRMEEKNLSILLDINTTPLKHKNITMLLQDLKKRLYDHLKTDIVFFVPTLINDNKLELFIDSETTVDPHQVMPNTDAIQQIWQDCKQGYIDAPMQDVQANWVYLPLMTLQTDVGVMAIKQKAVRNPYSQPTVNYTKLSDMIAVILEYINLDQATHARDVMVEKDKLRTHILSSVSHDLKTPLASIIGSLGLYLSSSMKLKENQIKLLIDNAYSEANRLDGFITNILTMTKLEAGMIKFRKEQIRPPQLLTAIFEKIRWKLPDDRVQVLNSDFRDFMTVDVSVTELLIINLLDNAVRHSPEDSFITLEFANLPTGYSLTIINKGPTIPPGEIETIFDKYARLQREDSQNAATGLGLALCRGLMQGQGGDITVTNQPDGVAFTVIWPEA